MFLRLIVLLVLCLTVSNAVFAQSSGEEKEKETTRISPVIQKKALAILDQTINEADSLKLPENRLVVYSSATFLLWENDEKRARIVAQKTANEIRNQFSETTSDNGYNQLWATKNQRQAFLTDLANYDAEFALQLLEQTRPPNLQMFYGNAEKKARFAEEQNDLNSEYYLEQAIISHLSEKNPRRVLETARKMLAQGLSQSLINLLWDLKDKNAETAKTLAEEILEKANSANLAEGQNTQYFFISLLSQFAPQNNPTNKDAKPLFSENDLRGIAQKLANYYLSAELNQSNYYMLDSGASVIERFSPAQAAQIKQRSEKIRNTFQSGNKEWDDFNKFAQSASPEEMMAQADNYPSNFRQNLYAQAAQKFADAGNIERAREILAANTKDDNIYSPLNNFDRQRFQNFLSNGKLDEAQRLLSQITSKTTKVSLLVQLALHFNEKKEKDSALNALDEARSLINPNPEDFNELNQISEVIRAYTAIDPKEAFDLIEPLIDKGNEVLSAYALISKYQPNNQSFRNGEFVVANGFPPCASSFLGNGNFSVLAKNDFARTVSLADKIQRPEIRISIQLEILRGIIAANSKNVNVRNITSVDVSSLPIDGRRFGYLGLGCG